MRNSLLLVLLFLLSNWARAADGPNAEGLLGRRSVSFTENRGQVADLNGSSRPDVLYTADVEGAKLFFQKDRVSFVFPRVESGTMAAGRYTRITGLYRMDLELLGSNPNVEVERGQWAEEEGETHFYTPGLTAPVTGVRAFRSIVYKNVYPKIDLVFYSQAENGNAPALKYDFVVHPGGRVSDIRLRYNAAEKVGLEADGRLNIVNPYGRVLENAPVVYQGRVSNTVPAAYRLQDGVVTFDVGNYDSSQDLVIDPLAFVWSTYLGSGQFDEINDVTVAPNGDVVVCGSTAQWTSFPNLGENVNFSNASIPVTQDAFIVRYRTNGSRIWRTIHGGRGIDGANAVAVRSGTGATVAVTGFAGAFTQGVTPTPPGDPINFFVSAGASQATYGGGAADAFVLVLNDNGTFSWATLYGGFNGGDGQPATSGVDRGEGVAFSADGAHVYVGGTSNSADLVTVNLSGSYTQANPDATENDAFLLRFNAASGARDFAQYFGGENNDLLYGLAIGGNNKLVITGAARSTGGTALQNPVVACATCSPVEGDGFVAQFSISASAITRDWVTFFGNAGANEAGFDVDINAAGSIAVAAGVGNSASFFGAQGTVINPNSGGFSEGAVITYNAVGQRQWYSYLGGSDVDNLFAVSYDGNNNVHVAGATQSSNLATVFPLIGNGNAGSTLSGTQDVYFAKLNSNGAVIYNSYLGGGASDEPRGIDVDASGAVYIAGVTASTNYPTLQPSGVVIQTSNEGGQDGFVTKINCPPTPSTIAINPNRSNENNPVNHFCRSDNQDVVITASPSGGNFTIVPNTLNAIVSGNQITFRPSNQAAGGGVFQITWTGTDPCDFTSTITITINDPQPQITAPLQSVFCESSSAVQLIGSPAGGVFSGTGVTNSSGIWDPSGLLPGNYLITYSGSLNGCGYSTTRTLRVVGVAGGVPTISGPAGPFCSADGLQQYTASIPGGVFTASCETCITPQGAFNPALASTGANTITYSGVAASTEPGVDCQYSVSVTVVVNQTPGLSIVGLPASTCNNSAPIQIGTNPPGGTISGPGVSFNGTNYFFNPSGAGVVFNQANILTATFTSAQGCGASTSASIFVNQINPQITNLATQYCQGAGNIALQATPAGGTFTFSGPANGFVAPNILQLSVLPAGQIYTVTYSGNSNGCNYTTSQTFTIIGNPTVVIQGLPNTACTGDACYNLSASITGGTFSGPGIQGDAVNGFRFCPAGLTGGVAYTITYSGNDPSTGCNYTTSRQVTVNTTPQAFISGLSSTYCTTNACVSMIGTPTGGTFAGPGVSGNTFCPQTAGVGNHNVTYSGVASNGCFYSTSLTVTVNVSPTVTVNLNPSYCAADPCITLIGSPSGGTFSIDGVTSAVFCPSQLSVGQHVVVYSGQLNGCPYSLSTLVNIIPNPNAQITGLPTSFCTADNPITVTATPAGGQFVLSPNVQGGLNGNILNPSAFNNNPGTYQISYTVTENGCSATTTRNFVVLQSQTAQILGYNGPLCTGGGILNLSGTPSGGTFSGPGIISGTAQFNPAIAGAGTHTIVYQGVSGGCGYSTSIQVVVLQTADADILGLSPQYCTNDAAVAISGVPAGGIIVGSGVETIGGQYFFNPSSLNPGVYTVEYFGNSINGCDYYEAVSVQIVTSPVAQIFGVPSNGLLCSNGTQLCLTATPAGGAFFSPGPFGGNLMSGPGGACFNPFGLPQGVYSIIYSGSVNGCEYETTVFVLVNEQPTPTITPSYEGPYCTNDPFVIMTGSPAGGVFSGQGITPEGVFNPAAINAGLTGAQVQITYSGNLNGCAYSTSVIVVVNNPPVPQSINLLPVYCTTVGAFPIQGSQPVGGSYSAVPDDGVIFFNNGVWFYDAAVAGTHVITYSGNVGGCDYSTSVTVTNTPPPTPVISGLENGYCINSGPVSVTGSPAGGGFSITPNPGNALIGSGSSIIFNTAIPSDSYLITYSGNFGGCQYTTSRIVRIGTPVTPTISGLDNAYCVNAAPTTMVGFPSGGTFSSVPAGAVINGNQFNPAAGVGCYEITYSGVNDFCAYTTTRIVCVNPPVAAAITNLPNFYCQTSAPIVLQGFPGTGTFSGPGVTNGVFNPAGLSGPVVITYTGIWQHCEYTVTATVNVTVPPVAEILSLEDEYCLSDGPVQMGGFPAGGIFETNCPVGTIQGGNFFYPSVAGPGECMITYRGNFNGCEFIVQKRVRITAPPAVVSINGLAGPYCITAAPVALTGTPATGSFSSNIPGLIIDSGTGQAMFNPQNAPTPGTYTITYSGDIGGCEYTTTRTVTITGAPEATITGLALEYCTNYGLVQLTGTPAGGTFSYKRASVLGEVNIPTDGFGNTYFNPATGADVYTIIYRGTFQGCPFYTTFQITVSDPPVSVIAGLQSQYCVTDEPVMPTGFPLGGAWNVTPAISLSGVPAWVNGMFNPAAGPGDFVVSYTGIDGGCNYSSTWNINVIAPQNVNIFGFESPYCTTAPPVTLQSNVSGGTWFTNPINGIINGNQFSPAITGPGIFTIVYTGSILGTNHCAYTADTFIQVIPAPVPMINGLANGAQLCTQDAPIELCGMPGGGTLSVAFESTESPIGSYGIPALDANNNFIPSAGPGTYYITYSGVIAHCAYTTTIAVTVTEPPIASISGLSDIYCQYSAGTQPDILTGTPPGGIFVLSNGSQLTTLTGGIFPPIGQTLAPGNYIVTYFGTFNGCSYATSQNVRINLPAVTQIANVLDVICRTAEPFTLTAIPAGGTFSGPGVTGNVFSPLAAGIGTHTITYSGVYLGCPYTTTETITIVETIANINAQLNGLQATYCTNDPVVTMLGVPDSGFYSGPGVVGRYFFPSVGPGTYTLTYAGFRENCSYTTSQTVTVYESPEFVATWQDPAVYGQEGQICINVTNGPVIGGYRITVGTTLVYEGPRPTTPICVNRPAGIYEIVVTADSDANNHLCSATTIVVLGNPPLPPCAAPTGIQIFATESPFRISWTTAPIAQAYIIEYRQLGASGPYLPLALVNAPTTQWVDLGGVFQACSSYSVRVRTICVDGATSIDFIQEDFQLPCVQGCTRPAALSFNQTSNTGGTLTWTPSQTAECYIVQYGLLEDGTFTTYGQVCGSTTVNIEGLIPGEEYCFQVLSVCADGEISAPRRICVTLSNIACGCPTGLTATSATNSINLSWNGVSGATGYRVEYRATGTSTFTTLNVSGTTATLSDLNCVPYDLQVSTLCGSTVSSGCGLVVAEGCGAPAGPAQFQLAIGRAALEEGYDVQSTTDGGYVISGYTSNSGNRDAYLAKVSACGEIEWERTYGGNFDDESRSVAVLPNGGYAVAGFSSSFGSETYTAYLLNINDNGTINWERKYGGTDARRFYDVQVTSDGGYILTGDALKATGSTDRDLLLMKVSAAGNVDWVRTFGGVNEDIGYETIETADAFVSVGFTSSFGTGGDIYVVKTNKANGATIWQKNYGGSQREEGYSIVADGDNYVLAGSTRSFGTGSADAYIVKINATNGNVVWANAYGGTSFDIAYYMDVNANGNYVITGSTQSAGNGNQAFLLSANASNGSVQWGVAYGGTGSDLARTFVQTADGGYAVFGSTRSFGENASAAPNFYLIKTGLQGSVDGCFSSNLTWNASNAAGTQTGTPTLVATTPVNNVIGGTSAVASVSLTRTVVCQVTNCGGAAPCNLAVNVTGSSTICPGGSATLAANATGASNVTFAWAGPNGFTATGSTINVSPTATSTYTVTATAAGCSPQSATGTVTIGNLTVSASATSAPNATVSATVSGGNAPYTVRLILNGVTIATNNNVTSTTTFGGVAAGTYTVSATSANGCTGSTSLTVSAGADCTTPTGLAVSAAGLANWNAVSGAVSYEVRYGITGTSQSTWTTLSTTTTSVQLTGLQSGSTYEVQVRTICAGGQSSAFSESTLFNGCPPPTNITFAASGTNVTASWTAAPGATQYTVSWRRSTVDNWTSTTTGNTSYTIQNLIPGATYRFRIRSRCGTTFGPWSQEFTFTVPASREAEAMALSANETLTVYPNPSQGIFTATLATESDTRADMAVTDLAGRIIYRTTVSVVAGSNDIPVDISKFAKGVYMLQIKAARTHTVKVVVE